MKKWWMLLLLVPLISVGYWWSRPKPLSVELITLGRGDVIETVVNTKAGTIKSCNRSRLALPLGGVVTELLVTEGDRVKEGQRLLSLWNRDLQAMVRQAEASLSAASLMQQSRCRQADFDARESVRQSRLLKQKLTSETAADTAATRAETSSLVCDAATADYQNATSQLAVAQAQLEKTTLFAPFSGIVAEVNGERGEYMTPSPPGVATPPAIDLIDDRCVFVSAPIDEVDAARLLVGQQAHIMLDAYPDKKFSATLTRIAPYVLELEKQARTVEVEARFQKIPSELNLLIGYSADVEVVLNQQEGVVRLPLEALSESGTVLRFEDDSLQEIEPQLGLRNWNWAEVSNGLAEGDRLVRHPARLDWRRGNGLLPMIELNAVSRRFQLGDQWVDGLKDVSLKIDKGEYLSIMGPSGSGKSTLLNVLGLLDKPDSGSYRLNDQETATLTEQETAHLRSREIGFIFQSFHLIPRLSAAENIELPLTLAGIEPQRRMERVSELVSRLGLSDRADHRPYQLSGGQRQRVAIGRSMAMRPDVLLADEPTGNLDSHSGSEVINLLEELHQQQGITLILVTHDPHIANRAERCIEMADGSLASDTNRRP